MPTLYIWGPIKISLPKFSQVENVYAALVEITYDAISSIKKPRVAAIKGLA